MVYPKTLIATLALFFCLFADISRAEHIITFDNELELAKDHLEKVNVYDRPFIKFLTVYSFHPSLRDSAALVTSFWLHSLTGIPDKTTGGNSGYYAPIITRVKLEKAFQIVYKQKVQGSDTLYWIDIRDYNWTEQAFETVSNFDPYGRKPLVDEHLYDSVRLLSGNAVLRADWFLAYTSDVTKQADFDIKTPLYYVLLYANVGIPKNGDEYRKIWGIDLERINDNQLARGTIVDRGKSSVSRNARELARYGLDTGYHWESSDFKQNRGKNDPIEHLSIERKNGRAVHLNLGRKADAHEYITSNLLGLQVYFLTNGKEERVEFADTTIVVDTSDRTGDVRVRTARSCVVCHPSGINIPKDALREFLGDGVDLIVGTEEWKQATKQFLLTDLGSLIQDDQVKYARSVVQTNGLLPEENTRLFQKILDWYDDDVTLEQAARECGVTVEEFKEKVGRAAKGRLARLCESKDPTYGIPRHLWDDPVTPGDYTHAMLLIKDLGALPAIKQVIVTVVDKCPIKLGEKTLGNVDKETYFEVLETVGEWFKVEIEGQKGYIHKDNVRLTNEG